MMMAEMITEMMMMVEMIMVEMIMVMVKVMKKKEDLDYQKTQPFHVHHHKLPLLQQLKEIIQLQLLLLELLILSVLMLQQVHITELMLEELLLQMMLLNHKKQILKMIQRKHSLLNLLLQLTQFQESMVNTTQKLKSHAHQIKQVPLLLAHQQKIT